MLTIKAEATPGDEIQNTFEEAIQLAKKLNCYIEFDFNGVKCLSDPKGSAKRGAEQYYAVINEKHRLKFAMS